MSGRRSSSTRRLCPEPRAWVPLCASPLCGTSRTPTATSAASSYSGFTSGPCVFGGTIPTRL
eukprot:10346308-Heterocapsa_arctica.AAC.1